MKTSEVNNFLLNINIPQFQEDLINWFQKEKRDLPWRQDQDPYKVWVSEIMLQQTKVDTVIPFFNNFLAKFPTLDDLAQAEEQEVLKAWEGLGYYSRARNLQTAVREVVASYDSKVPNDVKELGALKGIGPYTKGAILSIAYDKPEPAVDGNVMRVLSRILKVEQDIAKQSTRRLFEELVYELISVQSPSDFNQGLMELGALICTPKSPTCLLCPVREHCEAFAEGIQEELPIKSKAKKQKELQYYVLLIKDEEGRYVIEQRPESGLLANMWQFPMVSADDVDPEQLEAWIDQNYEIGITVKEKLNDIKHVFSHVIWKIEVFTAELNSGEITTDHAKLVPYDALNDFPFPVPHQKVRNQIQATK